MTWSSPRRNTEQAKTVGERRADDYEKMLERPLTADELAQIHQEAAEDVSAWGKRARG